ncbi:MAG: heavy metal translocating P-type ATPase metal-binding domain-containing protein [Bacteriovoracaceae bacterium]|nr:heavy metal translocating P-type ATPase metal-binding domain-containing protein [Bacteriovoracaceae bacterium]
MEIKSTLDSAMPKKIIGCVHCYAPCYSVILNSENLAFCCGGCLAVYSFLRKSGLKNYYEIKAQSKLKAEEFFTPNSVGNKNYSYLDQNDFQKDFSRQKNNDQKEMSFYIEGMSCLACVWVLEKIPQFVPHTQNIHVDLSKSCVKVIIDSEGKFSAVAKMINQMGYVPHPLGEEEDTQVWQDTEDKKDLIRIGVAAASAGNCMLFSVALYAGALQEFGTFFSWMAFISSLPSIIYGGYPFYKKAWQSLKHREMSIDVPLALSLVLGSVVGFFQLLRGSYDFYFDGLATLIFFILSARYFLKRSSKKGLSASRIARFFESGVVQRQNSQTLQFEEVYKKYIKADDILRVDVGQMIPVDGEIIKGETFLNTSLLTGEMHLTSASVGEKVFSGTLNMGSMFLMQVNSIGINTRLGKILKKVEENWGKRAPVVDIADRMAKYFLTAMILLAFAVVIVWILKGQAGVGIHRALSLIIITCPCALGLATPLALARTMGIASQKGIIVKDEAVIEKVAKTQNVFFDKTGTLTTGSFKVASSQNIATPVVSLSSEEIIYLLEKESSHPIAICLTGYILQNTFVDKMREILLEEKKEKVGVGVEGRIQGVIYLLSAMESYDHKTTLALYEGVERKIIHIITLQDEIRPEAKEIIQKLKKLKIDSYLLSGDNPSVVALVAQELSIAKDKAWGHISPEQKYEKVLKTPHALVVGDGANDALALSSSHVGIAVKGSMELAMRAADVYMTSHHLNKIYQFIILSRETLKVVKRNLWFSLFYNGLGVALALMGWIGPLGAAILMPVSSFTVLLSSTIGTKKMRKL